jgi:pilus assembly protein CpaB
MILIAAVVVGAVAAYALYAYVGGIEDRANEGAERIPVFKIVEDIPKGTFGDAAFSAGLIEESLIPRDFRPANAITSPGQIDGLVALADLAANQVVVSNQFVSQAESLSTFSSLLRSNEVAITISVDQVRGVAGLLVPGDFVNMLVLVEDLDPEATATDAVEEGQVNPATGEAIVYNTPARYLYQKVQILAVGQTRRLEPGETAETSPDGTQAVASSGLLTLSVPPEAAQRIASVEPGGVYLTLVPRDYVPIPLPPLDPSDAIPGEDADQLTPYGPEGRTDQ